MATNAQFFKSSSLEKYKALCDASTVVNDAFVLIDDLATGERRLYQGGEPLTMTLDPSVELSNAIVGNLDEYSYTFSVPGADGEVESITIENAWIPAIGDAENNYEMNLVNENSENKGDDGLPLYKNGLMPVEDKYKLEVLWKKLGGKVDMSNEDGNAYIHDFSWLQYKISFSQQDVDCFQEGWKWLDIDGNELTDADKQDIPVYFVDSAHLDDEHKEVGFYYDSPEEDVLLDIAHDGSVGPAVNKVKVGIPAQVVNVAKMRKWITNPQEGKVLIKKMTATTVPYFQDAEYMLYGHEDSVMMANHGGLEKGLTGKDIKEKLELDTVSKVLNKILFGSKAQFVKVQDVHCVIEGANGFDPKNVHPDSSYPTPEEINIHFYNEVWRLYNADGSVVKDAEGKYIDVEIYEEPKPEELTKWIFDGEHADLPRHWEYMDEKQKAEALHFNPPYQVLPGDAYNNDYFFHLKDKVKENDKCVYFGACATKKVAERPVIVYDNETYYPYSEKLWEEVPAEIKIYTDNAWSFGDHYVSDVREEVNGRMIDPSAYWCYKPATLDNITEVNAYGKVFPAVNDPSVHFFDMDVELTFSAIYANVNVSLGPSENPEISFDSLYYLKNVEPKDYVNFKTQVVKDEKTGDWVENVIEGLNNTGIYARDNERFYIKWPSATMDSSKFVIAVPEGFAIRPFVPVGQSTTDQAYVGTAHDTYEEKYTLPVSLNLLDSSNFIIKRGEDDYYRTTPYRVYVIGKVGGITTACIDIVKEAPAEDGKEGSEGPKLPEVKPVN